MKNVFISRTYSVSQEKVNQYAQVSGGNGAIHTDPEYAKTTYFKKTLVHGLYILALIEKEFNLKSNNLLKSGQIQITYLKPVVARQPFHIKYIEISEGNWEVTVWSNNEAMVVGFVSL